MGRFLKVKNIEEQQEFLKSQCNKCCANCKDWNCNKRCMFVENLDCPSCVVNENN